VRAIGARRSRRSNVGHPKTNVISPGLLRSIRQQYQLSWRGIHGAAHWARVLENGLRLAEITGARIEVVQLFAVFHDACRLNDDWDPDHGRRGSKLAATFRGTLFQLSDADFALLRTACDLHADGHTKGDITVQTCWDADRLDLGRIGIDPDPQRLCTAAAKRSDILQWARERSVRQDIPKLVEEWETA